jgi:hypothetical protein
MTVLLKLIKIKANNNVPSAITHVKPAKNMETTYVKAVNLTKSLLKRQQLSKKILSLVYVKI